MNYVKIDNGHSWTLDDGASIRLTNIQRTRSGDYVNLEVLPPGEDSPIGGGRVNLAVPGSRNDLGRELARRNGRASSHWEDALYSVWQALLDLEPSLDEEASKDEAKRLQVRSFAEIEPESVNPLWPGRVFKGKLTVLGGDPGLGKSMLTLDMASKVSRGSAWPNGGIAEQGNVLIITAEDGASDTVRPRLDALGADVSHVFHIDISVLKGDKTEALTLVDHLDLIESEVIFREASLLIIDPVLGFTGRRTDTHKSSAVRPILAQLNQMAERTGCAVVGIIHLNKRSTESNALYRFTASLDFVAAARSVLVVAEHPDDESLRVLASAKCNIAQKPPSLAYTITSDGGIAWEQGTVNLSANELMASSGGDREPSALREAEEFLEAVLTFHGEHVGAKVSDIKKEAENMGISWRTLNRAKLKLGIKAHRLQTGERRGDGEWIWQFEEPDLERNDVR